MIIFFLFFTSESLGKVFTWCYQDKDQLLTGFFFPGNYSSPGVKKGIIFPETELNFNSDQQIGTYLMINLWYRPFAPETLLGTTELGQPFNSTPVTIRTVYCYITRSNC